MTAVTETQGRPTSRRTPVVPLIGAGIVAGVFVVGLLVGRAHQPSQLVHVDRQVTGEVVMVSDDGDAIVIHTGSSAQGSGGNESFELLRHGAAPQPGDTVEGTVLDLAVDGGGGGTSEAIVLR